MQSVKNAYLWECIDFSENKAAYEVFGLRFKTEDEYKKFAEVWKTSLETNSTLDWEKKDSNTENKKEE